jgi:CBS domain-containing protein
MISIQFGLEKGLDAMSTVNRMIKRKGSQIWSISPNEPLMSAVRLMAEQDVGAVLVIEEEKLIGIVTERDIVRKVTLQGKNMQTTNVREAMSGEILSVRPDQTVYECMAIMSATRIRYLPIMENERLLGVISITDVVREIIRQQSETIQFLQDLELGR